MKEEERIKQLEAQIRGLSSQVKQLTAQQRPGTVVNFFTGLGNRFKKPLINIAEEGKEINAKSYFTSNKQAAIEEELAKQRRQAYIDAGLEPPDDLYYPEDQGEKD